MGKNTWKVYYNGNFWGHSDRERAGKEVRVNKVFKWYDEIWHIPAVYLCGKGLVVDFCVEIDPQRMKDFLHKWEDQLREEWKISRETRRTIERENPMELNFSAEFLVNSRVLKMKSGCGVGWLPSECYQDGIEESVGEEAEKVLDYYGLDKSRAWTIRRCAYPWLTSRKPVIKHIEMHLQQLPTGIPGETFVSPSEGETAEISHPITGEKYTLKIEEYLRHKLPEEHFGNPEVEYPSHFTAVEYSVDPDLNHEKLRLFDTAEGDSPRRKSDGKPSSGTAFGIIGGADGPTAVFLSTNSPKTYDACSSLHFVPQNKIVWQPMFYEKLREDLIADII